MRAYAITLGALLAWINQAAYEFPSDRHVFHEMDTKLGHSVMWSPCLVQLIKRRDAFARFLGSLFRLFLCWEIGRKLWETPLLPSFNFISVDFLVTPGLWLAISSPILSLWVSLICLIYTAWPNARLLTEREESCHRSSHICAARHRSWFLCTLKPFLKEKLWLINFVIGYFT